MPFSLAGNTISSDFGHTNARSFSTSARTIEFRRLLLQRPYNEESGVPFPFIYTHTHTYPWPVYFRPLFIYLFIYLCVRVFVCFPSTLAYFSADFSARRLFNETATLLYHQAYNTMVLGVDRSVWKCL